MLRLRVCQTGLTGGPGIRLTPYQMIITTAIISSSGIPSGPMLCSKVNLDWAILCLA